MSELRYHPFLGEWVITATHRQDRTFLPPDDFCPLCPTKPGGIATEIPFQSYDIAVFENKFPSLAVNAPLPAVEPISVSDVDQGMGVCEVICYSQDHAATFATLPASQIRKLTRVWQQRYIELAAHPEVDYVFIFENKGKEIGVTMTHPHGQIYGYPFIPPVPGVELSMESMYLEHTGNNLWEEWLKGELNGPRQVLRNEHFVAVVPFFARYPYEVWVVPIAPLSSLKEMLSSELDSLGEILHELTQKYDRLFGFSLPYIMAMHQEPAIEGFESTRFHVEFYPPHRSATKLKYLAGSEAGAGAFIVDVLPEDAAKALQKA